MEAAEASQYYFFENRWKKLKCPHLLKPLGTQILNEYWSFYPSKAFSFDHFTLIHPVVRKKVSCNALGIWKNAYISTEHFTTLVYKFHQTLKTRNSAKFSKAFQPWTWGKLLSHKLYPKIVAERATCLKGSEPKEILIQTSNSII